ncbi:MAG: hypothetical protein WCH86_07380 [Kiritimatiellales bacterium]
MNYENGLSSLLSAITDRGYNSENERGFRQDYRLSRINVAERDLRARLSVLGDHAPHRVSNSWKFSFQPLEPADENTSLPFADPLFSVSETRDSLPDKLLEPENKI